jgi:hypothetical protein
MNAPVNEFPTLPATVDPVEVASRISIRGTRGAIGASTIEIVALAKRVLQLTTLADLAFDLLTTADLAMEEKQPEIRRSLAHAVRLKVSDLGFALEAIGYGQDQPAQEKTDVTED